MAQIEVSDTALTGVRLVQRNPIKDERGFFARFYCADKFREIGVDEPVVQMNHSLTCEKGAARGLHFQFPPHAEFKLVSCLSGSVFDVAVDLRKDSPTFLHWHGEVISAENFRSLLIPPGVAHGFQALSEDCELLYLHTAFYNAAAEGVVNLIDPAIAIEWPLALRALSDRDRSQAFIGEDFSGIAV